MVTVLTVGSPSSVGDDGDRADGRSAVTDGDEQQPAWSAVTGHDDSISTISEVTERLANDGSISLSPS